MVEQKKCYPLLFLLFFVTYGYFFQGGGWNQNIRICQIRAILHDHTFIIDTYKEDSKNPYFEFVNSGDWAYYNGHFYSNKAPGLSFLSLLPFGLTEYCARHIFPGSIEQQVFVSAVASNLCTVVLSGVLLCLLLFYVLNHFLHVSQTQSLLLTVCFGFGTLAFSYSTIFYGHVPAAFFCFLAFVLALAIKQKETQNIKLTALCSGLSVSCAVLIEPSCMCALIGIMGYFISFRAGRQSIFFFLLGCIPPALLQCYYNAACFGNPLASGYAYANPAVMFKVNGKLFGLPKPGAIIRMLCVPNRGLFMTSPVLVMAVPGLILFLKKRQWLSEALCCCSISCMFVVFVVSYYAWYHAATPGPRYMLPAFPFMFLLTTYALYKFPKTFTLLGTVGIIINLIIALVGNEIPHDIGNPLTDFILKNFLEGKVSINPVPFSNFENYAVKELAYIDQWRPNFNSFNAGELLMPNNLASVLPLLCFWIWWVYAWKRYAIKHETKV